MNSKFFDLKKEKQDRMINAALKVFAMQGYRHASTDEIVKEAAISKGLLFHYFGSKLGVYTFIFDYSVRFISLELRASVKEEKTDFFEYIKRVQFAKIQTIKRYPYMQQFLNKSTHENVKEALFAVEEMQRSLQQLHDKLETYIDVSDFPSDVDFVKLRKMLEITFKGLMMERFQDASLQADMLFDEIIDYLEMVKKLVYKTTEDEFYLEER